MPDAKYFNNKLDEVKSKLFNIYNELLRLGEDVTAKRIANIHVKGFADKKALPKEKPITEIMLEMVAKSTLKAKLALKQTSGLWLV